MLSYSPGTTHSLKEIHRLLSIWENTRNRIRHFVKSVSSLLRKEVWLLEPSDSKTGRQNAILFSGNNPEKHYIGKLLFKENYTHRPLGRYWLWQILFPVKKLRDNCSFSVIQTRWSIGKFLRSKKMFCIPTWVFGSVDLNTDFNVYARQNKSTRCALRKINKAGFRVETSSDPQLFDEFFHQMHQPYMLNRHGECAVEESYHRMKARFLKNGEMLFIVDGSRRVAGTLICFDGKEALAYRLGVLNGDFAWVAKGAISALYYHTIMHCRSKGIKKLNLGGSRPFLSDGVLTYKLRNWNMKIDDYSKHFYFLFKPLRKNDFTREFLSGNPFISLNRSRLVLNTFCDESSAEMDRAIEMKIKYIRKGLKRVDVHHLKGSRAARPLKNNLRLPGLSALPSARQRTSQGQRIFFDLRR